MYGFEWPREPVMPDKNKPANGGLTDRELKWIQP